MQGNYAGLRCYEEALRSNQFFAETRVETPLLEIEISIARCLVVFYAQGKHRRTEEPCAGSALEDDICRNSRENTAPQKLDFHRSPSSRITCIGKALQDRGS